MSVMTGDKKLSTNQATLILIMLAVVVWVIGLIISKSVFDIVRFNNKLIGQKRSVESTLQENLDTVDELKKNYANLETVGASSVKVLRALPDKPDVPGLASRIENLLQSSSVAFESFSLVSAPPTTSTDPASETDEQTTDGVQELSFNIQVSGTYANVRAMLANFERELSPMRITELKIGGTESITQASLIITSYYQDRASLDVQTETIR